MDVVIGVDGGATKTRAVVVDLEGQCLAEGMAGPTNFQVVGVHAAAENLATALRAALDEVEGPTPRRLVVGVAGLDSPEDAPQVQSLLRLALSQVGLQTPWFAVNDSVVAWAGALEGRPGAIVVSGSGAVALAVNERGESAHADGWGHWLGDEGSGFDIGRRGLQAALRAMDGRGPQTQLLQRVRRAWGEDFTHQIGDLNEDVAQAHRRIAGFAPEVVAAAQAGDCVAVEILRQAGRDLANTGASVLRRAGLLERPQVATIGSVFGHAALLRQAFCQALAQLTPGVEVRWPVLQPAEGAALLARDPRLAPLDVLVVRG